MTWFTTGVVFPNLASTASLAAFSFLAPLASRLLPTRHNVKLHSRYWWCRNSGLISLYLLGNDFSNCSLLLCLLMLLLWLLATALPFPLAAAPLFLSLPSTVSFPSRPSRASGLIQRVQMLRQQYGVLQGLGVLCNNLILQIGFDAKDKSM